jgi:hypothetical protein
MRYTLLNRFQGSLLGAAIGEILGANCSDRHLPDEMPEGTGLSSWLTVHHWGFQPSAALNAGWGSLAIRHLRHLLQTGSLTDLPLPKLDSLPELDPSLSGLAIATLPIALFYHENPDQMQAQIQLALAHWQTHWQQAHEQANGQLRSPVQPVAEAAISVLLVSYTLSLILREQFSPATLITDFIHYFDLPQTDFLISQLDRLLQTEPLLPTSNPALLALAAFLKTPDNYRLSLLQAAQTQVQPSVACAIVGALSGAYNGKAGLPLDWCLALSASSKSFASKSFVSKSFVSKPLSDARSISLLLLLWEVESEMQLLEYANQLFVSWSGVYKPIQCFKDFPPLAGSSVLAAPRVIRSR